MTQRLPVHGLDPASVPDGTYALQVAGGVVVALTESASGGGGAGAGELLTTTVNGVPELVWDDNDNLVYAEGSTA